MLSIAPAAIDFGDVAVGASASAESVTLSNTGSATLHVTALDAAQAPFARTGGTCSASLPITLAAGADCTLAYAFSPTQAGAAAQSLAVTADAPGSGSIALTGNGVQGHLAIAPAGVDFGSQAVGTTSAPRTVTLANDGTAPLHVTALDAPAAPFARSGGTCPGLPVTLAPGADCTLAYTFSPEAPGAAQQVLAVAADAPGDASITLAGTGAALQADVAVTLGDDRGFVQVGDTLDYVITVSNAGPAAATASVQDVLPAGLGNGTWVCVPTGAATCTPAGSGDTLADSATLPVGTSANYVYSATVQAGAPERIENTASAAVGAGVVDPVPGNDSATDADDVLVIFRDGFDAATQVLPLAGADGVDDVAMATLRIDPDLFAALGIVPVAVAVLDVDGRPVLVAELARFGATPVMRLVGRGAGGRTDWQAFDSGDGLLDLAWQAAPGADAIATLDAASGGVALEAGPAGRGPVRLRVARQGGTAWLVPARR
jgi:uncharacterized repeat protein (TIGR01451 family)